MTPLASPFKPFFPEQPISRHRTTRPPLDFPSQYLPKPEHMPTLDSSQTLLSQRTTVESPKFGPLDEITARADAAARRQLLPRVSIKLPIGHTFGRKMRADTSPVAMAEQRADSARIMSEKPSRAPSIEPTSFSPTLV